MYANWENWQNPKEWIFLWGQGGGAQVYSRKDWVMIETFGTGLHLVPPLLLILQPIAMFHPSQVMEQVLAASSEQSKGAPVP